MNIAVIHADAAPAPIGAYSQGVVAGPFVFTSGMGPIEPGSGQVLSDDVVSQTHLVLDHIATILAERGLGLSDVVKMTVHLQNPDRDFAAFDSAYRSRMTNPYPVRTTVGSTLNGILVEIDAIAVAR